MRVRQIQEQIVANVFFTYLLYFAHLHCVYFCCCCVTWIEIDHSKSIEWSRSVSFFEQKTNHFFVNVFYICWWWWSSFLKMRNSSIVAPCLVFCSIDRSIDWFRFSLIWLIDCMKLDLIDFLFGWPISAIRYWPVFPSFVDFVLISLIDFFGDEIKIKKKEIWNGYPGFFSKQKKFDFCVCPRFQFNNPVVYSLMDFFWKWSFSFISLPGIFSFLKEWCQKWYHHIAIFFIFEIVMMMMIKKLNFFPVSIAI